jgi:hypothetical protein
VEYVSSQVLNDVWIGAIFPCGLNASGIGYDSCSELIGAHNLLISGTEQGQINYSMVTQTDIPGMEQGQIKGLVSVPGWLNY